MAKENKEQMVTVTVAPRRAIHVGLHHDPVNPRRVIGPGQTCQVPKKEVARLIAQGFIKDPDAEPLPSGAADINIDQYLQSSDAPAPELIQAGDPAHSPQN